ncbi:hypothetical protein BGAL_0026g00090 [Botrytis galanthina]|uniref:Rhodopsin domain-containing protein n=1 Tax=Botrytis galanthina TaxID=278940 RepID=A0A4S8R8W7_9HELO|nr:hypothetical protein BGAL_0026g00090 [Botrytis galanthina]
MSDQTQSLIPEPSLVKESVFKGIVWGGMAISFLFVSFRLGVRLKNFRRLFLDDFFVVLGWSMIFATTIIWHFAAHDMFMSTAVASGQISPLDDPTYISDTEYYLRSSVAVIVLFYSSLVAIKMSFLIFFRRLTEGVDNKAQTIQWWTIFGIVIAVWLTCLGTIEYQCLAQPLMVIQSSGCIEQHSVNFQRATLIANCVLDVLSDILIITIPIAILWNVRIRRRQKLALAGLFSLTMITMTFAIVRVAVVSTASRLPDISWLYLWSAIEPPIAVIISCLASFRGLFAKQEGSGVSGGRYVKTPQENDGSYKYELQSKRRKKNIPLDNLTTTLVTTTISSGDYDRASTTSGNRISGNLVFPINGPSENGDRRRVD